MLAFMQIVTGIVFLLTRIVLGLGGTATVVLLVLAVLSIIGWNVFWFAMLALVVTFVVCIGSFVLLSFLSEK